MKFSSLDSRILVWIRYTGKHSEGNWHSCRLHSRVISLLDSLDIVPTIKNGKVYFSWVYDLSEWPHMLDSEAVIDELQVIKNLNIPNSFYLSDNEIMIFDVQISQQNYVSKWTSNGKFQNIMIAT